MEKSTKTSFQQPQYSFPPSNTLAKNSSSLAIYVERGAELYIYIYIYIYNHDFAKIYGPPQILQKCTSAAVAHGGRSRQEWARTLNAAGHGVMSLMPWATTLGA
jgi:hypothetical protein